MSVNINWVIPKNSVDEMTLVEMGFYTRVGVPSKTHYCTWARFQDKREVLRQLGFEIITLYIRPISQVVIKGIISDLTRHSYK
jgi:hypothetical protein